MSQAFWDLARRARQAESDRELGFILVNDTVGLAPYRQAALWLAQEGVWCLSGVVQVDANVPHVQWLDAVAHHLTQINTGSDPQTHNLRTFTAQDLPADLAAQWDQWWPAHAVWLGSPVGKDPAGAGILVREEPFTPEELPLLNEWGAIWWHAFAASHRPKLPRLRGWKDKAHHALAWVPGQVWWRQRRLQVMLAILAVLLWPVRLTVLAPGELVPAHPVVIRAPLDGVIDIFHVQPNQKVQANQPLFSFDEMVIQSRLEVAQQALATAETDYRQTSQQALIDMRAKAQLGVLAGKVEERRAESDYLQEQLARARVLAPQPGLVLMDDPSDLIGKPVATGERILRIATLDDIEVEAWLPLADAIVLEPGDSVTLYLSANPLSPVSAHLRYMAHDAVQRPDGSFAYRVRATLDDKTQHRVGLKGTARVHGSWVPLAYWMLRRPWATVRGYLGW